MKRLLAPLAVGILLSLATAPSRAEAPAHHEGKPAAEAEAGHAGHGAHHVRHLDNWFSLSFGPGKEHQNGPLAFAILNFALFIWLVVRFGGKPFRAYLEQRHQTVRQQLEEAAALHEQARQKLAEIDRKLRDVEQELAEIREGVAKDAQVEKERIIKAAEAEAQHIVAQADETLSRELRRARRLLEVEAVESAVRAAEKLLRQRLTDADRRRLNDEYFAQIGVGRDPDAPVGGPRPGGGN
jgi:F-type H+-transporting ATPase subunit b